MKSNTREEIQIIPWLINTTTQIESLRVKPFESILNLRWLIGIRSAVPELILLGQELKFMSGMLHLILFRQQKKRQMRPLNLLPNSDLITSVSTIMI